MPALNSHEAESIRENMVRMCLLMGCFPYANFSEDVHPTAQNPYPWTPDVLWDMPEFRAITETWVSDCGRCRGAELKLEYGWKLLATITDARTYIEYDWDSRRGGGAPLFVLSNDKIAELAA